MRLIVITAPGLAGLVGCAGPTIVVIKNPTTGGRLVSRWGSLRSSTATPLSRARRATRPPVAKDELTA